MLTIQKGSRHLEGNSKSTQHLRVGPAQCCVLGRAKVLVPDRRPRKEGKSQSHMTVRGNLPAEFGDLIPLATG